VNKAPPSAPELRVYLLARDLQRQFGVLEVHGPDLAEVERAGRAILAGMSANAADQLRPRILFADVIEDITDRQAVIINRGGSMMVPGDTLLVCEVPRRFSPRSRRTRPSARHPA
jgi:hypothetical protein